MVDFRPLLFVNALALMLLVTAGFASIREDRAEQPVHQTTQTASPSGNDAAQPAATPSSTEPEEQKPRQAATEPLSVQDREPLNSEPFTLDTPENELAEQQLAMADPAMPPSSANQTADTSTKAVPESDQQPKAPEPTTAALTLRSNVYGDEVIINGDSYGTTRLDLELDPGRYDVTIRKPGYKAWSQSVALEAGDTRTLRGKLEKHTRVNYQEGRWVGGVKTGDGTFHGENGLIYNGHFVDGQFHGDGTAQYPDGSRYEGEWKNGQRSGEGTLRRPDGTVYEGSFADDRFNGQGTLTRPNGDVLTGQWEDGELDGEGSLTAADGRLYVGSFRNGEFHGQGTLTYPDGRSYEGTFSKGEYHGKGTKVFADGKQYQGQFVDGDFHGKGILENPNGSSIQATFKYGEPYGQVKLTTPAGEVFRARTSEPGVCYREKSYRATQCPPLEGW
ncbi:hypothetical protein C8D92_107151 [Tamilnaduibacter salinus]|uniref:PEGA domain-containing protein n=1 Tax=Tamilnaduibacter salinus TaxID=1484056 RepID=A0A2A2I8K4_9GAMM|nr:PEGA domain-containing protein [Tamilnaduibacter salinus]PAV27455.1 PEGA domain-containing protein [Tamilnaduibacter salinus]PVY75430.1 hypothetical protein C8D92_107151 [Tamilnaduibacter salinus]